ncbi:hypothetical protein N5853_05750 [Bartonella sp. HY329]|uniref:hypothetical protein n=1 Tax=unclassified Bartonella TaxID=2645622 RepID=UPI0021CA7B53|nr:MULTISPECIES: hypothetical protein [unclassified Bartonella]UXM96118.1 hypothetical protein N5853_05750 [Bartonella sp. HY329]UXN10442.1 hypothetical protein N5852_05755 [Bartonella sp. HY328]
MKKIIYVIFAFLLFNSPAVAAKWEDSTKTELQEAAAHWFHGYELKDANRVVATTPPGFMRYTAYKRQIIPLKIEAHLREEMQQRFDDIKSIKIDFDPEKIVYRKTSNDKLYALIPYNSHIVSIDNKTSDAKLVVIAFQVSGIWYFTDIQDPEAKDSLLTIYSYFKDADLTIPDSTQ